MVCLSVKYYRRALKWFNTYIASLLWSVRTSRLKTEPFLLWGWEWVAWGAMHNWIYVHSFCQRYRDLDLLDKTSKEFEEKSYRLKTFKFLSNELTLDLRITALTFFISYFIFPENKSSLRTISISADILWCLPNKSPTAWCFLEREG